VSTMDAEPSILCGPSGGPSARMRAVAALTIVLYVLHLTFISSTPCVKCQQVSDSESPIPSNHVKGTLSSSMLCSVGAPWIMGDGCRYVLGLPALLGVFLWRHKAAVRADQTLRERGEGDSPLTNANYQVRAEHGYGRSRDQ
jgi:hypothetical protein